MSPTDTDHETLAADRMRLVARLLRGRAELLQQLTGLPAETLTGRPVFDDWSATNILAHIASWDEFFAVRLGEVLAGRGAAIQPVEVDERNALTSRQRRNWGLDRSLAALTAARTELLAAFNDIAPEALHAVIGVPWGQPTVARWIEICIEHDKEHAGHLREWRTTLGDAAQARWHTSGPGSVLAAALAVHREALLAHMAFVSPREQETRPVVGPWTLKDLVGHVADWELQGLVFIRAILAREEPVAESDWDLDRWNAKNAIARSGEPWEKTWGDFLAARRDLLALLRTLDDDALNTAFEGPLGGTPYNWFYMAIDHDREHTEDLRRIDESDTAALTGVTHGDGAGGDPCRSRETVRQQPAARVGAC